MSDFVELPCADNNTMIWCLWVCLNCDVGESSFIYSVRTLEMTLYIVLLA